MKCKPQIPIVRLLLSALLAIEGMTMAGEGLPPYANRNLANVATVGGGRVRIVEGDFATIGGGRGNLVFAESGFIGGGRGNLVGTNALFGTIPSGEDNQALASHATVGGGLNNANSGLEATIAGGNGNGTTANNSVIGGGMFNQISTNASFSTLGGGRENSIRANSASATIGGGKLNSAAFEATTIAGGEQNRTVARYTTIAGGFNNLASMEASSIGGGSHNATTAAESTVGGGRDNLASGVNATIGGGRLNSATHSGASVLGGQNNVAAAEAASIGGGSNNQALAEGSLVAGGRQGMAAGYSATVGGGEKNQALADYATVGGGRNNTNAGISASISGGFANLISVNGSFAMIPGGRENLATDYAFAAGRRAKANHTGAFVWADSTDADFASTADNQLAVRASGGARFETGGAGMTLDGSPVLSGKVGREEIADGAVTTAKLANGVVSAAKIANGAIMMANLADGVVSSAKIADGTIEDADISDTARIDASKLAAGRVSNQEYNALDGVTSGIQTQLDQKLAATGGVLKGSLQFAKDTDGILFAAAGGANKPMITMFPAGSGNGERTILAHSPNLPDWGLRYNDTNDQFRFGNGALTNILNVAMTSGRVGIGREASANEFEVEGSASKTSAGAWLANSDARIKQDIQSISGAVDKLRQVRLVSFRYTKEYRAEHPSVGDRRYVNVVAQEFAKAFPDDVKRGGDKLPDGTEILQVDTYPLVIYSAAAVQELHKEMTRQTNEIAELQRRNATLEHRLEALENFVRNRIAQNEAPDRQKNDLACEPGPRASFGAGEETTAAAEF